MAYKILYRDRKGRTALLPRNPLHVYTKLTADHKVHRSAECWREPPSMVYATSVFHSPGLSRTYFNSSRSDYIEAERVWVNEAPGQIIDERLHG